MTISQIAKQLSKDGFDTKYLEQLVYEMASSAMMSKINAEDDDNEQDRLYSSVGAHVATINSGGLNSQIHYLVSNHGFDLQQLTDWLSINSAA